MFDRLGNFVTRYWPLVLVAWVVGVAAIQLTAPPWAAISQDDDIKSFPRDFASVVGHDLLQQAFPQDVFNSQVVVVVRRSDGPISDMDLDFMDTLAARLTQVQEGGVRREPVAKSVETETPVTNGEPAGAHAGSAIEDKYGLGEFLTPRTPVKGQLLLSHDQMVGLLVAPCKHTFMAEAVRRTIGWADDPRREPRREGLRGAIAEMKDAGEVPSGLEVAVTGSAGVGADIQMATDESLKRSLWVTVTLVLVILLIVYRSPVVALIPLVTIGVSVATAMGLMSLLTLVEIEGIRFQVMKITEIFVIVVLFGAGTDYCLFLIARYREELEQGNDPATAVRLAIRHVGGALAASAATVVFGLGMMASAEFGKIRYTGPAVGVSLAVALVGALTLTPALLRLMGPWVFWPFPIRRAEQSTASGDSANVVGFSLQQRLWEWVSQWLARRPLAIWAISVAVLLPFFVWGMRLVPTYDFLAELDQRWESKRGLALIQQSAGPGQPPHFPKGTLGPLTILLRLPDNSPHDLRQPEARKDITALTEAIQSLGPDRIAQVRSLTYPVGQRVDDEPQEREAPKPKEKPKKSRGFLDALSDGETRGTERAAQKFRQRVLEHYVSTAAAGRVMRLDIVSNVAPFSRESMALRDQVRDVVRNFTARPDTVLAGAEHTFAGITSTTYDLRKITQSDQVRINWLVILVVYAILVVLLRKPVICAYLMVTVLFSYWATLGMTEGVFRLLHHWQHPDAAWLGLDWKVAFFLFIILVAVGEDYNILLMSRVVEEQEKRGVREGVRAAVARTGGIITSCGIIMAGTFGSMCTGTLAAVIQLGFALALGVLLDTFIVRPILVPAFLLMLPGARAQRPPRDAAAVPHVPGRAARPVEGEPVSTADRRGLLALLLAWLGRGL